MRFAIFIIFYIMCGSVFSADNIECGKTSESESKLFGEMQKDCRKKETVESSVSWAKGLDFLPNPRGLSCDVYEFAELNSLDANELVSLVCSYDLGIKISESSKPIDSSKNAKMIHLQKQIDTLQRCSKERFKASIIFFKKFANKKIDCQKITVKTEEPN